ncbi:isochorismate synthase [Muricauda sp. JGD-17]|uniref:isochorismate synthase n=1 Tax=Flagellimonas ochracea TaxID=2696472 RepID=A0A964WWM5_9FLAO|nr:chorismate-binding protein [Allomuricauda ochracea]NAY91150.1 isochorismate synthase [Allomuricauda ochracea]
MHYPEHNPLGKFFNKMATSFEKGLPFSCYRKPGEKEIRSIYQHNDALNRAVTFKERGFVFAPFDLEKGAVLVQPDDVQTISLDTLATPAKEKVHEGESGKLQHINLVEQGISEIRKGHLEKVVLSRRISVERSKGPIDIFYTLLSLYPQAFCYLFYHPKVGTWCGATPETLVQISNNTMKTMSLAATMPYQEHKEPEWGSKEIEEQQLVSDYIRVKLQPLMEKLKVGDAKSTRAGNLWHLKSKVKGTLLPETDIGEIITSLHPTPAVCGIPVSAANTFIKKHEGYDRGFYTGFLGELNLEKEKEISLFVNLRCMELHPNSAFIFVGGGITAASDPESEWTETQNKSLTMFNVL